MHLHVVSEANANIGFREKNICQKECTLLLLRRNRDGELLLRAISRPSAVTAPTRVLSAITTLDRDSTHSSTARHPDPPGPG